MAEESLAVQQECFYGDTASKDRTVIELFRPTYKWFLVLFFSDTLP